MNVSSQINSRKYSLEQKHKNETADIQQTSFHCSLNFTLSFHIEHFLLR
jgi:hypothetical protein